MTNEHEHGINAAAQKLLARGEFSILEGANRTIAHIAAEEAISAYIEAACFDSVPALLSRIEELERERDNLTNVSEDFSANIDYAREHVAALADRATAAESKLADAVKALEGADILAHVFEAIYHAQPEFLRIPEWKPLEEKAMTFLRSVYPELEKRWVAAAYQQGGADGK